MSSSGKVPLVVLQHQLAKLASLLVLLQLTSCSQGDIDLGTRGWVIEPIDGASRSMRSDAGKRDADRGVEVERDDGRVADVELADPIASDAMVETDGTAGPEEDSSADAGPIQKGSAGCGSDPTKLETSIRVNGMTGTYVIDVPADYDANRPYPLLLSFRGVGATAAMFRTFLNFPREVGSDGIVVNANCLNDESVWSTGRDLPYIDALITKLAATYCVDEDRIFAVGHGPGAQFVSSLGCLRGSKLRGIAPLSGSPPAGATCEGDVAVWISQGNADPLMPLGRANRDFWANRNKCTLNRPKPVEPSSCVEYDGCTSGHPVVYCEYDGDLRPPDFAASAVWAFFKRL